MGRGVSVVEVSWGGDVNRVLDVWARRDLFLARIGVSRRVTERMKEELEELGGGVVGAGGDGC